MSKESELSLRDENHFPNYDINVSNSKEPEFSGKVYIFDKKEDGTFDMYESYIRFRYRGLLSEARSGYKFLAERTIKKGRPIKEDLSTAGGFKVETPFIKNVTENEVRDYYKKCGILYTGESQI